MLTTSILSSRRGDRHLRWATGEDVGGTVGVPTGTVPVVAQDGDVTDLATLSRRLPVQVHVRPGDLGERPGLTTAGFLRVGADDVRHHRAG